MAMVSLSGSTLTPKEKWGAMRFIVVDSRIILVVDTSRAAITGTPIPLFKSTMSRDSSQ
jgi:hypothetical protein